MKVLVKCKYSPALSLYEPDHDFGTVATLTQLILFVHNGYENKSFSSHQELNGTRAKVSKLCKAQYCWSICVHIY